MKKLCNKKGFTLSEMLISIMLLGIVSLMVTVMTSAILNSTMSMQEVAQAEILGSEALDNLQDRLRFANNVTVDSDGSITFDLDEANPGYTFGLENGRIIIGKKQADGSIEGDLLFAGVSYGNLNIDDMKFAKNEDLLSLDIAVSVSYAGKTLWNGSVSVSPLNGVK